MRAESGVNGEDMKGSFTVEASVIVPLLLLLMLLALRQGISLCEETTERAESADGGEEFEIVETLYRLEQVTDIWELLHGDSL